MDMDQVAVFFAESILTALEVICALLVGTVCIELLISVWGMVAQ